MIHKSDPFCFDLIIETKIQPTTTIIAHSQERIYNSVNCDIMRSLCR